VQRDATTELCSFKCVYMSPVLMSDIVSYLRPENVKGDEVHAFDQ
jgi:hypothetical protein